MNDIKWKHFCGEIILGCVRWYCKYAMSYRDLEEIDDGTRFLGWPLHFVPLGSAIRSRRGKEVVKRFQGKVLRKVRKYKKQLLSYRPCS